MLRVAGDSNQSDDDPAELDLEAENDVLKALDELQIVLVCVYVSSAFYHR